jgi:hypothetical protein
MEPPDVLISPNYKLSDFDGLSDTDAKILVFEDRINGWFLDVAQGLLDKTKANEGNERPRPYFAVLAIVAVYFEMIGQYVSGKSSQNASKERFCEGLEKVFSGKFSDDQRRKVYKSLRCALYHNGLTKGAVIGIQHTEPIYFEHALIWINPYSLLKSIKDHFASYIDALKNPTEVLARANFETIYDSNPKL